MTGIDFVFTLAALTSIASAGLIVSRKNPVYSVVWMLPFFLAMTTIFVLLEATFLAAIQMIVYGGAILVVFMFVIMLINLKPEELKDDFSLKNWVLPGIGIAALLVVLCLFIGKGAAPELQEAFTKVIPDASRGAHKTVFGSLENIAYPLFEQQMVPFELASVLIIVATLGAVLLSKRRMG